MKIKGPVLRIWKSWTDPQKIELAAAYEVCPCCGGRVFTRRSTPGEMAIAILCSVLLLALVLPTAYVTEQWIERQSHKILDRMVIWREPIDRWNLKIRSWMIPLGVSLAPRDDLEVNLGGRLASGTERDTGCHLLQIQFVEVACESAFGALVHALPANGFVPLVNSQLPSPQQPNSRKSCSRPWQLFPIRFYPSLGSDSSGA
jgi:hypothetical protein